MKQTVSNSKSVHFMPSVFFTHVVLILSRVLYNASGTPLQNCAAKALQTLSCVRELCARVHTHKKAFRDATAFKQHTANATSYFTSKFTCPINITRSNRCVMLLSALNMLRSYIEYLKSTYV